MRAHLTPRRAVVAILIVGAIATHGTAPLRGQALSADDDEFALWTSEGTAFVEQPIDASMVTTSRFAPITVGGDYWRDLIYPLGQDGRLLIMSAARGEGAVGTFSSPSVVLSADTPFFSFLIGGSDDPSHERVELRVSESAEPSSDTTIALSETGSGHEQLRSVVFRVPDALVGHAARVVIVDDSPTQHINVDAVRFTAAPPVMRPTPVWGYADFHTHPMTYLAFGALKGVRTIWGAPGGRWADYLTAPGLVAMDLPACVPAHGGGPFAGPFLNGAQKMEYKEGPDLLFTHREHGWPDFDAWPSFIQGTHQQMHITQIRRNYEGGLRLMVALATDNVGAEYLMSSVGKNNRVALMKEQASLEAQLSGMKGLAALNSDWMQIAYTPEEAREIILHNKLAIVMGIEMDQLGTYGCSSPAEEVKYLWGLGVRVVTPIHAADNLLGGAAVFIGPYNWLNDLLHRGSYDVTLEQLKRLKTEFFAVEEQTCDITHPNDGECIQNKLEWDKQKRLYLGNCFVSVTQAWFLTSPCLQDWRWHKYHTVRGHANAKGLTPFGEQYLEALMAKGMIIDTAHMSDKSVEGTYAIIGKKLAHDHPGCEGFSFRADITSECNSLAYPAIISHAHFRGQAFYGGDDFLPSEYDISNRNLEMVRRVGGVVGPFIAEDRVSAPWDNPEGMYPLNDCAMSSKSFAYSFRYAAQRLGRFGVGLASDLTFIPGVSPRFGKDNGCWGYHLAKEPDVERRTHRERYAVDAQTSGVIYEGLKRREDVTYGTNTPLIPYSLNDGTRAFDYNIDGLAHYGMMPDMLQDLANLSMPRDDRELLFRSADDYIRMWERTFSVAGR